MKISEIIFLVLTSSVLASVLTLVGNRFLISINYKHDYHKKIIDKRLSAYEAVDKVISELLSYSKLESDNIIHAICVDKKSFDAFINTVSDALDKSIWLSSNVSRKLSEINVLLVLKIKDKIEPTSSTSFDYRGFGEQYYTQISNYTTDIKGFMNEDLKSLYKVEDFFKQKDATEQIELEL